MNSALFKLLAIGAGAGLAARYLFKQSIKVAVVVGVVAALVIGSLTKATN